MLLPLCLYGLLIVSMAKAEWAARQPGLLLQLLPLLPARVALRLPPAGLLSDDDDEGLLLATPAGSDGTGLSLLCAKVYMGL